MDEKKLLKIVFMCSILGLLFLIFFSSHISLEETSIGKIDGTLQTIKVYGEVESIRSIGTGQVVKITQPSSIEVFIGSKAALKEGDVVEVIGRIDEYNGNEQIIAQRIRSVKGIG